MKKTLLWLGIDVLLVLLFAFQGRSAHESKNSIIGILDTAWPFLVGLAVGWLITRQWKMTTGGLPVTFQIWPASIMLVLVTWAIGLLMRSLSGDTNAGAFPLVALGFLLLMMVGWRIVWGSIVRIKAKNVVTVKTKAPKTKAPTPK